VEGASVEGVKSLNMIDLDGKNIVTDQKIIEEINIFFPNIGLKKIGSVSEAMRMYLCWRGQ